MVILHFRYHVQTFWVLGASGMYDKYMPTLIPTSIVIYVIGLICENGEFQQLMEEMKSYIAN